MFLGIKNSFPSSLIIGISSDRIEKQREKEHTPSTHKLLMVTIWPPLDRNASFYIEDHSGNEGSSRACKSKNEYGP